MLILCLMQEARCNDWHFTIVNHASSTKSIKTGGLYFEVPKLAQKLITENKIEKVSYPTISIGHYLIIKSGKNYRIFRAHVIGNGRMLLLNCRFDEEDGELKNIEPESFFEGIIITKEAWNSSAVINLKTRQSGSDEKQKH